MGQDHPQIDAEAFVAELDACMAAVRRATTPAEKARASRWLAGLVATVAEASRAALGDLGTPRRSEAYAGIVAALDAVRGAVAEDARRVTSTVAADGAPVCEVTVINAAAALAVIEQMVRDLAALAIRIAASRILDATSVLAWRDHRDRHGPPPARHRIASNPHRTTGPPGGSAAPLSAGELVAA